MEFYNFDKMENSIKIYKSCHLNTIFLKIAYKFYKFFM